MRCRFETAYQGQCTRAAVRRFCAEHLTVLCASCGRQAVRTCDEKMTNRVCHVPLCSRCTHVGDSHLPLPDQPGEQFLVDDLQRMLGREPAARQVSGGTSDRTAVEDLRHLLVELEGPQDQTGQDDDTVQRL